VILVPVVDLKDGAVVHARRGERGAYRPVRSGLCAGHDALEVVRGFLRLHPFAAIYIADLDAIEGRGDNLAAIAALSASFPNVALWVDAGLHSARALAAWRRRALGRPVVGSESLLRVEDWTAMAQGGRADLVLSLDFRGTDFLGPRELLGDPDSWPRDVIVMTLERVGGAAGPDVARVRALKAKAGGRRVFAAGGVRDRRDLQRLAEAGAAGVLLASALHDGRIGADDIARAQARG
jgi:phosphoribosylformimino-5-aminoimidazole carboxamide ribotide isomerase